MVLVVSLCGLMIMNNKPEIINKVAQSGLVTIDLETLYPSGERVVFDLKNFLFQELILKEKDFRERLNEINWHFFDNKYVALTCSADAIIPTWAYMLVSTRLASHAKQIVFGTLRQMEEVLFHDVISQINPSDYSGQRVVIKGCSQIEVPVSAYVELSYHLKPFVKSIMYGEPCSTVPVYKKEAEDKASQV